MATIVSPQEHTHSCFQFATFNSVKPGEYPRVSCEARGVRSDCQGHNRSVQNLASSMDGTKVLWIGDLRRLFPSLETASANENSTWRSLTNAVSNPFFGTAPRKVNDSADELRPKKRQWVTSVAPFQLTYTTVLAFLKRA